MKKRKLTEGQIKANKEFKKLTNSLVQPPSGVNSQRSVVKELQQLEWIIETLKYDLKVCERVIKNYKKDKYDLAYGRVTTEELAKHTTEASYIKFLLEEVLTGNIYKV